MTDLLLDTRQKIIDNFQVSLRAIRTLMGYSAIELSDYVGVTRQTINNLETLKSKMTPMQYVSLAAVVDNYVMSNGEMIDAIETILDGNQKRRGEEYGSSFTSSSLLKRWFSCFYNQYEKGTSTSSYLNGEEYTTVLRKLSSEYKVFIDAEALMNPQATKFLIDFSNYLLLDNSKIIVPMRAIEKIQELVQMSRDSGEAIEALKRVNELQRKNLVQVRGEDSDTNLQDTLISVFAKFRSLYRICLITQNENMNSLIKSLNSISDPQGFEILSAYIDQEGKIRFFSSELNESPQVMGWKAEKGLDDEISESDVNPKKEDENNSDPVISEWLHL